MDENMYIINVNYAYCFYYLEIHMETNGKQKLGGSFVLSRSKDTDSGVSEFISLYILELLDNEMKYIDLYFISLTNTVFP